MIISEINIYPIKSLAGIALDTALVEDRGLQFDRRWMLVDEKNRFLTQREFPVMSRIKVELGGDSMTVRLDDESLTVAFGSDRGDRKRVTVWKSSVKAAFYSGEIDDWFSKALGTSCRLAAMKEDSSRKVNPFYAVRRFKDEVSFADGYPFLLIGEGSLDDLNSRLEQPLPMNRFRPNFVVSGSEAFAEDTWKTVRIGSTVFHVVKPCGRCTITTVDQATGAKTGAEPLKTLAAYRKKRTNVLFGQNLIAEAPGSMINVGDRIEVLEYKQHKRSAALSSEVS
jgi:uncharacterized protein